MERIFAEQQQLDVAIFEVPKDCRFGPWANRRWELKKDQGRAVREVLPFSEVLCPVSLSNGALDMASLEKLSSRGLATGQMPSRDKALVATL